VGVLNNLDASKEESEKAQGLARLAKQKRTERELRGLVSALTAEIDEMQRALDLCDLVTESKPLRLPKPKKRTGSPVTPVVLWSDWHIEETVLGSQTNGRNEYNPDVARARYERLIDNTSHLINRESTTSSIGEAVVWLGGDFMSGHIHEDLVEVTSTSPTETAAIAHQWLLDGLKYVADQTKLDRILVPTSFGNHGRINKGRPRIATAASHNLEQFVYGLIARDLKDDNRFQLDVSPTAFKYLSLGDMCVRFTHGDTFSYGGGIGGLAIPLHKAVARWNEETRATLTCFGHYHQKRDFEFAVGNGSLIGTSEYSRRFGYEPPQQVLFFIDRERNAKAGVHPVFVE